MCDPTFASLDIETYGIWHSLANQTVFHPRRMFYVDRIPLHEMIQCVSLTLPKKSPKDLSIQSLAEIEPGPTMVFEIKRPQDRAHFIKWLGHIRAICGMNLAFDVLCLRAGSPLFRHHVTPRLSLIDLSVVNFLENPSRPEKSLKTIGLALNTHSYDISAKTTRFTDWRRMLRYCGEDTHNTLVAVSTLARRILSNHVLKDVIKPFTLQMYSDTQWSCIQMSENGVPIHRPSLESLAIRLHRRCRHASKLCEAAGLQLSGAGSQTSKDEFMKRMLAEASAKDPSIMSNPVLGFTPTGRLQISEANRDLLTPLVNDPNLLRTSEQWSAFVHADKLIGTYCFPLLYRRRKIEKGLASRKSVLCPQSGVPLPFPKEPHPCFLESTTCSSPASQSDSSEPSCSSASSSAASAGSSGPPTAPSTTSSGASSSSSGSRAPSSSAASRSPTPNTTTNPKTGLPNRDVWLSHTSWYIVPSAVKDDGGAEGGTIQGRITCKDGAHQTDPDPIQACHRSRFHGGVLLGGDLSQIELRVPALTSGEPLYLNAFLRGDDMHTGTARMFWSDDELFSRYPALRGQPPKLWKKLAPAFDRRERQVGKRGNFARGYRAGADKIQASVHGDIGELLPLEIFEKFTKNMKKDTPLLWNYQERLIKEARQTRHIILPVTGQQRQFGGSEYDVNEICNFPIQTIAGNVMNRIQARFRQLTTKWSDHILPYLNVYDALKIDCRSMSWALLAKSKLIESCDWVAKHDYWAMLQDHYKREVPISMDFKMAQA
jgi:hypothetical protein